VSSPSPSHAQSRPSRELLRPQALHVEPPAARFSSAHRPPAIARSGSCGDLPPKASDSRPRAETGHEPAEPTTAKLPPRQLKRPPPVLVEVPKPMASRDASWATSCHNSPMLPIKAFEKVSLMRGAPASPLPSRTSPSDGQRNLSFSIPVADEPQSSRSAHQQQESSERSQAFDCSKLPSLMSGTPKSRFEGAKTATSFGDLQRPAGRPPRAFSQGSLQRPGSREGGSGGACQRSCSVQKGGDDRTLSTASTILESRPSTPIDKSYDMCRSGAASPKVRGTRNAPEWGQPASDSRPGTPGLAFDRFEVTSPNLRVTSHNWAGLGRSTLEKRPSSPAHSKESLVAPVRDEPPRIGALTLGQRMLAAMSVPALEGPPKSPKDPSSPSQGPKTCLKDIQVLEPGQKIYDLYFLDEVLQEEGNGGKVVICRSKEVDDTLAQQPCVMKIRTKDDLVKQGLEDQFLRAQVKVMNLPPHAGIVPIHALLEDEKFYYLVMAKADEGCFFQSLLSDYDDGCMPATAVRQLLRDILEAVCHIHKNGILHRDLKPDNLVMHACEKRRDGTTKRAMLIDFDHADPDWDPHGTPGWEADEVFGTLRFCAPEALQGRFSAQSDLFSVGALLYLLMTGAFPYPEELYEGTAEFGSWTRPGRRKEIVERQRESAVDFSGSGWSGQEECREICQKLLAFEPSARPASAEEVLRHRWFRPYRRFGNSV